MYKCSMISSLINKCVFLRVFYLHSSHNLCGVYIWLECKKIIYFSLVYIFEGMFSYMFLCVLFLWKRSCILRVLISWSCTHVVSDPNNECTPRALSLPIWYGYLMVFFKIYIYIIWVYATCKNLYILGIVVSAKLRMVLTQLKSWVHKGSLSLTYPTSINI